MISARPSFAGAGAGAVAAAATAGTAAIDDPLDFDTFSRWVGSQREAAESSLRIGGMHCAACAGIIERALRTQDGVVEAHVSAAAKCATVRWDPARTRPSALVRAIEAAGYQAVPDTAAAARVQRRAESRLALWRLFVAVLCAMQVMMLAAPAYFSAPGDLAPEHKQLLDVASWLLTLPVMAFCAEPFFAGAWASWRRRRIAMEVPVALGIAVAFIASSGATFDPGGLFGSEVWFDSLTMFLAFLLAGRWLEMRARHHAEQSLEQSLGELPTTASRLRPDGQLEQVSARRLVAGDRVRVAVGEAFVADGVLIDGDTHADEALLSGEARPVAKPQGAGVVAGSVNIGAPVLMQVQRVGVDTRFEAIVALMRGARSQRPPVVAAADRWAAPFLWTVLVLAALAGALWTLIEPSRALPVLVSVLIVTCPCALSLAAPSALLAAAATMGRQGLLLRRLDAIQGLARMQLLFVDKTGTLTDTRLHCVGHQRLAAAAVHDGEWLRRMAASLASWSQHPLAVALVASAAAAPVTWQGRREVAGQGLEGIDGDGVAWRLGAAGWAGGAVACESGTSAHCWLARDGVPLLRFDFDETLRADAAAAVRALQREGVAVQLLSGDDAARVARLGTQLALAEAVGGLSPQHKLLALRAAQRDGRVVGMLGDGINDAPVLAQADVSLAMGEGALLARTEADAVLLHNRLGDLVRARALARRTLRVLHQNFAWAGAYNAACVPLALFGAVPPWAAGLGMALSSLLVVLNSQRLAS